ncbi:MAG: hypothetical protein H6Q81_2154, partial [Deltaproteobacteria bacterium]|nr:hypothetical protein [Deltaproteobacteria bacterium]
SPAFMFLAPQTIPNVADPSVTLHKESRSALGC